MTPFVVDANVMNMFQQERLAGNKGLAQNAVDAMTSVSFIALDADGHCAAEWMACAGGKPPLALQDWLADMFVSQKVRLFPMGPYNMYKELISLGLPKKDHKWIKLARSVPAYAIVTEDIDLFDPTKKKSSLEVKRGIKASRSGPVATHLNKSYQINVMCCSHIAGFIQG